MNNNKKIKNIFTHHNEVLLAYLFGSFSEGRTNKDSDIDIGILLESNIDAIHSFELRLILMSELEDIYRKNIEIIILNNASILLRHEVIKQKRLLFAKDESLQLVFESICRREYFDFIPIIKKHTNTFLDRIKCGGFCGSIRSHRK